MRILVVEDEENVAQAIKVGLEAEGFGVDLAADGDTGYWMACERDYAAIVLDVMLPARNGYRICADLRADGQATPILMLTAKDGEYDEAEGLDTGADDYLRKPFSMLVLLARIRALLRRGHGALRRDVLCAGDLELDRDTRRCWRGELCVELTRRELALMAALLRRPAYVVSKDQLLDEAWGADFVGGTNVVEVYVGYLRRKLAQIGASSSIETVHGSGYRFKP